MLHRIFRGLGKLVLFYLLLLDLKLPLGCITGQINCNSTSRFCYIVIVTIIILIVTVTIIFGITMVATFDIDRHREILHVVLYGSHLYEI